MSKYGFGTEGGIELPKADTSAKQRPKVETESVEKAVQAGSELGFVSREPNIRLKPGPKRTHRCSIMETGNESGRFKTGSDHSL